MIRQFGRYRAATLIFSLGVLVLCPIYLAAVRLPAFGLFHDDGIYVVTAKALAEGHGYHIISLPSAPPQTKYPPLFPLLLATVWSLAPDFPANLTALKLVPLLATVVWLWLSLYLLRALDLSPSVRSLVCLATIAAPFVIYLSATLLSETVFAALCTGALLCLEDRDRPSLKRVALAGALAGLAALTRIAGVSLIGAGMVWLLLIKRAPRQAALFAGIAALCLTPWWIWAAHGDASGYYGVANYINWNVLAPDRTIALSQRVRVVFTNLLWMASAGPALIGGPVNLLTTLAAALLVGAGAWRVLPQQRVSLWFLIAYATLIALWAWPPLRFVAVVLPLGMWLAFAAVNTSTLARATLMIVLALTSVRSIGAGYHNIEDAKRTGVLGTGVATDNWGDIVALGQRLRAHTTADEIIIGNLDPVYYLLTGRKAIRAFDADPFRLFYSTSSGISPIGEPEALVSRIKAAGATVVIEGPDVLFAEGPWLRRQIGDLEERGDLHLVEQIGGFRILRPGPQ
jgi:hypothetical protein